MFLSTEYVTITCCHKSCHCNFAMTKMMNDEFRKSHERFYCPHGHGQSYNGESAEEKLQRELNRAKQNAAYLESRISDEQAEKERLRHSANAFKGHVTRIKKRVGQGVCPCCNRTFKHLAKHMAGKHPEYADKEPTEQAA